MNSYRKRIQKFRSIPGIIAGKIITTLLVVHFLLQGRKPFIRGYDQFKKQRIASILKSNSFSVETLPKNYGEKLDERVIEYPWLFSRLPADMQGRLLDAGSVLNFEYILDQPSLRNKKIFILTLAPELHAFWERGISYIFDDLRSTAFKNDYFDWIVSISTLEHVGLDNTTYYSNDPLKKESNCNDYIKVIKEYHRILRPGGVLYLSVPFGAYKNHSWLQVFDTAMVKNILDAFDHNEYTVSFFRYTPRGWMVAPETSCSDAIYYDYHTHGYSAITPAAAEAVACIELRKRG